MLSIRFPITRSAPPSSSRDEARDLVEVVGEVGVGHHDVRRRAPPRSRRGRRCRSRAAARGRRAAPAARARPRCRRRAVVGDDHLAREAVLGEHEPRLRHALLDVLGLVQARDDDRDAQRDGAGPSAGRARSSSTCPCSTGYQRPARPQSTGAVSRRSARRPDRVRRRRYARPDADLHRLRLPLPVHGRRRGALVPRTSRERLAEDGHEVTYLTLRQWERARSRRRSPACAWSRSARGMTLYVGRPAADRSRRSSSGSACSGTCSRHGRRYDVVHTASFPYFSLLAAAAARRAARLPARRRLARALDARLLARVPRAGSAGAIGWRSSGSACASRSGRSASRGCTSDGCARRACNGPVTRLEGEYDGPTDLGEPLPAEPVVVFAGRHIPEKRVTALVPAFARAREAIPSCGCEIFGDGPERPRGARVRSPSTASRTSVEVPGFVDPSERSTRRCGARSASCCRRAARATGWS